MEMHTSTLTLIKVDICIDMGYTRTHYRRGQTPPMFCESEYFMCGLFSFSLFFRTFFAYISKTVTHSAFRRQ